MVLIMSDDIEALPDVWLHNLLHLLPTNTHSSSSSSSSPAPTAPVTLPDGFVGLSQKVPFNGRTTFIIIIIILFSTHSPQLMRTCSISVGLYDINIREMSE